MHVRRRSRDSSGSGTREAREDKPRGRPRTEPPCKPRRRWRFIIFGIRRELAPGKAKEEEELVYTLDPQTGRVFKARTEKPLDHLLAVISFVYLLVAMAFVFWLTFDMWIGASFVDDYRDFAEIRLWAEDVARTTAMHVVTGKSARGDRPLAVAGGR